jgi:hypothetical protein
VPLPTPLRVPTAALSRRRPPSRVGVLVLTAFGLAALATVTGHAAGLALLIGATAVLGVAAALAMRAHWAAALPVEPRTPVSPAPAAVAPDGDSVTAELRRLHAAHVEKVNLALDEGRDDLARELADSYTDEALALLVRG